MHMGLPWSARFDRWAFVAIVAVAAVVRVLAARGEPWLDEIWSLGLAEHATSLTQIVTDNGFHIDNNHWLNTAWMAVLGQRQAWLVYRLPAVLAGIGTVVLAWPLARRWGRAAALIAGVLLGVSFVFVEYGSEARGYAPAAFCGLAAAAALVHFVDHRPARWWAAAAFGAACVLGVLWHATFIYAFAGAAVYAPLGLYRRGRRGRALAVDLAALLAGPLLFFGWLYVEAIRPMRIAGGPQAWMGDVLASTWAYTAGLPPEWRGGPIAGWAGLIVVALVCGYGAATLARRGRDEWVLLLTSGLIAPVLIIAIRRPEPMMPRYLFVALPFVLLLAAGALDDLLRRRWPARGLALALLLTFIVGNGVHLWRFSRVGRGGYRAAIESVFAQTPGPVVNFTAAQKFRAVMYFGYYLPRIDTHGKTIQYVPPQSPTPPDWFLVDTSGDEAVPMSLTVGGWPDQFRRTAVFEAYGLSGATWYLFRREHQ